MAAEQAELTARHAQVGGPAGEQPSAAEAALKQRLRKVELTVAGKQSSCLMFRASALRLAVKQSSCGERASAAESASQRRLHVVEVALAGAGI